MCLKLKKKGKYKVPFHKFCIFDSDAVWQLFHLTLTYLRIIVPFARLLNEIK